jgi:hypothetical protein
MTSPNPTTTSAAGRPWAAGLGCGLMGLILVVISLCVVLGVVVGGLVGVVAAR